VGLRGIGIILFAGRLGEKDSLTDAIPTQADNKQTSTSRVKKLRSITSTKEKVSQKSHGGAAVKQKKGYGTSSNKKNAV